MSLNSILKEAHGLIYGARAASYGHALDNFSRIAETWNWWMQMKADRLRRTQGEAFKGVDIQAEDVAVMMTLLKLAREGNKPQRDNVLDGAGYLGCYEQVQDERVRRNAEPLADDIAKAEEENRKRLELSDVPCQPAVQAYHSYKGPCECSTCVRVRP